MKTNAFSSVSNHGRRCLIWILSRLSGVDSQQVLTDQDEVERQQRALNLQARQKAMYEQMMQDGTHLFAGKKYRPTFGPEFDEQPVPVFLRK